MTFIQRLKQFHSPVGLRTLKTAAAVSAAILLVEQYGTSADELLFGVMGAFSAMEPTFKGSVRGCISQFMGVLMGVLLSLALRPLEVPGAVAAGIGIVLVMACYQVLRLRSSPVLPCLILVTICTKPELGAVVYGLERLWNTALGMGAGMAMGQMFAGMFNQQNQQPVQQAAPAAAPVAKTFCPECGQPVAAGAKFCANCGAKQQSAANACPGCGQPVAPGAKFCANCGQKL